METNNTVRVRVRVSTTGYQFDHGAKPRGFGGWMFSMGRDYNDVMELAEDGQRRVVTMPPSTFGQAKAAACRLAASRGFEDVVVCS